MDNLNFLKDMTSTPLVNNSVSQMASSDEGIMVNNQEFNDPEQYINESSVEYNYRPTAPGEVSQEAILALTGGFKVEHARALNQKAIMESATDLPKEALKNLLGGNIQEAREKAHTAVKTSRLLSVDDPMQYVTNTKTILEERIKAKAAAKGFINEGPVQREANNSGISQEDIDKIVEDKVMDILQNMAELKGKERANSEILMVVGDKIYKGNLKMIGKIK